MNDLINKALFLAKFAHVGAVDKAGVDYIKHPHTVASMAFALCLSMEHTSHLLNKAYIVGLLHDTVEDTFVSLYDVRDLFGDEIADAVDAITKRRGHNNSKWEPTKVYWSRVKANNIARIVKIADMTHNKDLSRIESPTEVDVKRSKKYENGIKFLSEV